MREGERFGMMRRADGAKPIADLRLKRIEKHRAFNGTPPQSVESVRITPVNARPSDTRRDIKIAADQERRMRSGFALLAEHPELWAIDPRAPDAYAKLIAVPESVRHRCLDLLKPIDCPVRRIMQWHLSELTLSEIGDAYGISRERVRQIEEWALAKMRVARDAIDAYDILAARL